MAGQTPRFNFNFFGGDTDGTIGEDDEKFTGEDRLSLDSILASFETHTHRPVVVLGAPVASPTIADTVGGSLLAGTTYFYVVSFVNADGQETTTGPEASHTTPDVLPVPAAPQGATADSPTGALTPGLYYYALSALRGGEETALSELTAITILTGDNGTVELSLPSLGDADSLQIWRQESTDPGWTRIGTSITGSYTDLGAVAAGIYGDPTNTPPEISIGIDEYQLTITLAGADVAAVQATSGWRIYRSTVSGVYGAASLVHQVIEREDDLDPTSDLLTSFVDDGDAALTGSPKIISTELMIPAFTFDAANPLPSAAGYPQNYAILDDATGVLYLNRTSTWTAIGGSGGGTVRGQAFMGDWDNDVSYTPGYEAGDVVVYGTGLFSAITPAAAVPPSATTSSPPPFATIDASVNYYHGNDTAYTQHLMFTVEHTVSSIGLSLEASGTDPITVDLIMYGTGVVGTATIADPSALSVGWNIIPLSANVSVNTFDTYIISTSGLGAQANVDLCDGPTLSGDITVTDTVLDHTDTAITGRYMVARLYGPDGAAWAILGYVVPPGGATGESLKKISDADGDYGWVA
jgi:hypothetical protein